ncbi:hypothetical protein D6C97_03152 [Aureobasidium pullulans]|nr:hypothetical protein D6C97_03152 [Aureobasidium pullulans]
MVSTFPPYTVEREACIDLEYTLLSCQCDLAFSDSVIVADETSWPACIFVLECLLKKIIEIEKQEDSLTTTSKASPLMRVFKTDNDDFRLHHYFDLICGAGIGGKLTASRLASPMLGHLRLSLQETITRIAEVRDYPRPSLWAWATSNARIENSRHIHTRLHHTLEPEALRSSLDSCNSPRDVCHDDATRFSSVPGMCQTLVFAARKEDPAELCVFRSYQEPAVGDMNPRDKHNTTPPVSLVNVCRVAMANPSYFESVDIRLDPRKPAECMIEATTKDINLSSLAEQEVKLVYDSTSSLHCLLEIGGQAEKASSSWRFPWSSNEVQTDHFRSEAENNTFAANLEKIRVTDLNVLAHHITRGSRVQAENFCLARGLYAQLEKCARLLVEARRARADTSNWEIFAFSDRYTCSICRGEGRDSGILDKPAFFDHVDFTHEFYGLAPPEMMKIQEESKLKL